MGCYTRKGSAALDARINADMARIAEAVAASPYARLYRAGVLLGGYGRGEGTPLVREGREEPFNDYDLIVVVQPLPRSQESAIRADLRRLEEELTRELGLPVDLYPYRENKLPQAEFSLLNYEMKYGHRVIWGASNVLDRMPAYPHDAVPFSEGTRLLLNRGKLLLDIQRALRSQCEIGEEDRIKYIKFMFKSFLSFGDCTLLIHRDYDLSYAEKVSRIARYATADLPDPAYMIAGFRQAVAFKEWGDLRTLDSLDWRQQFAEVRRYYLGFFRWYEARRLKTPVADPPAYARALATADGRECSALKAAALNLHLFHGRALENGIGLFLAHPRTRLYQVLLLLLDDAPAADSLRRLLSAPPTADLEMLEQKFHTLHRRLS